MKCIREKEFIKLSDLDKVKILKQISKGEVRYISEKEEIIFEKKRI